MFNPADPLSFHSASLCVTVAATQVPHVGFATDSAGLVHLLAAVAAVGGGSHEPVGRCCDGSFINVRAQPRFPPDTQLMAVMLAAAQPPDRLLGKDGAGSTLFKLWRRQIVLPV